MCEQTLIHTCSQEYPGSARCVQSFDDSLDSAIRITYRISLRSSSMREPRHPSLKVVWHSVSPRRRASVSIKDGTNTHARGSDWSQSRNGGRFKRVWLWLYMIWIACVTTVPKKQVTQDLQACFHQESTEFKWYGCFRVMNDPTAGSPTVTLLRLHLPLNDEVWANSHGRAPMKVPSHDPETSPNHSIGRCDGRCVQRAGT